MHLHDKAKAPLQFLDLPLVLLAKCLVHPHNLKYPAHTCAAEPRYCGYYHVCTTKQKSERALCRLTHPAAIPSLHSLHSGTTAQGLQVT